MFYINVLLQNIILNNNYSVLCDSICSPKFNLKIMLSGNHRY